MFEGKARATVQAHRDRAWLAWHVAALPLMKRFPKLEDIAGPPRRRRRKGPAGEAHLLSIARRWHAALTSKAAAAGDPSAIPKEGT